MKSLLIAVLLVLNAAVFSQEEEPKYGWAKEAVGSFTMTQTQFDNYVQGGENSFTWQANFNFLFIHTAPHHNWANTGKFGFGKNKTGEDSARKSVDEIYLETVYTYKQWKSFNPYVSATAETQFAPGYSYAKDDSRTRISNVFDPAYFRESVGFNYIHPKEFLRARAGLGFKQTLADEFAARYSDDPDTKEIETLRSEVGLESVVDFNYKVSENSLVISKLELFSNLQAFDEIDVKWDTDLTAKVTQYIALTFNFKLLYDKDVSAKRQIKQTLGVGISYSFF